MPQHPATIHTAIARGLAISLAVVGTMAWLGACTSAAVDLMVGLRKVCQSS